MRPPPRGRRHEPRRRTRHHACWEVADLGAALATLLARGATLHRGPAFTDFGARVALPIDPLGNTLGVNQAKR